MGKRAAEQNHKSKREATDEGPVRGPSASQLDVARLANVSQAAVSRAFTPGASISSETRAAVLAAARALGYRPNAIARSLVTHQSNIIAIIMANMWNPFYSSALAQLTDQLQALGYWVLLFRVQDDSTVDDALLTALEYQVDGAIITSATLSSRLADECARHGVPVVLFNRYTLNSNVNAVWCDSVAGGRVVADAVLDVGFSRIAFMAGDPKTSTARDREAGFTERLHEANCSLFWRGQGDFTHESGVQTAREMLSQKERPDVVFCANDLMAMATLDVARDEFGVRVPAELAVIGFDDIPMAAWPHYSLTTVRQPLERLVSATTQLIQSAIQEAGAERVLQTVPGELVVRTSAALRPSQERRRPRRQAKPHSVTADNGHAVTLQYDPD
jgi:DNA-binding LacI/PurR family transcriptional regulator